MIDPWELLLHHSYTGKPGVIFDQSPGRKSHGTPVNLSAGDFQGDGAEAGSGAIAFHPNSVVKVVSDQRWTHLSALRCEVVCICDADSSGGGMLVSGESFGFGINPLHSTPTFSHGNTSGGGALVPQAVHIPFGRWFTFGITYNGLAHSEFTIDGEVVSRHNTIDEGPLNPTRKFWIGNSERNTEPWTGRIDDVKVWRYSPHWVDNAFTNRPVDSSIQDCWKRWTKALSDAFKDDPECAAHVRDLIDAAVTSLIRHASATSTEATWQAAIVDYQQRWPSGDFHQLQAIMADVVAAIGGDLQLTTDPALLALANDPCLQKIAGRLPKLDCNPGFIDLVRNTAEQIELLP